MKLTVFEVLGKEIKTLLNEIQTPGSPEISFDVATLTSGLYYYKRTATGGSGEFAETKRMLLLK